VHTWKPPDRVNLSCQRCEEFTNEGYYVWVFGVEKGPFCHKCGTRLQKQVEQAELERSRQREAEMQSTLEYIRNLPEAEEEPEADLV